MCRGHSHLQIRMLPQHIFRSLGEVHAIALLLQQQWCSAGLYEIAGAELVHQNVIQAVRAPLVRQLYGILHTRSPSAQTPPNNCALMQTSVHVLQHIFKDIVIADDQNPEPK